MVYRQLLVLVRRDGYPLGWCAFPVGSDGTVSLDGLAAERGFSRAPPDSARAH